jgi:hypothetical protein
MTELLLTQPHGRHDHWDVVDDRTLGEGENVDRDWRCPHEGCPEVETSVPRPECRTHHELMVLDA